MPQLFAIKSVNNSDLFSHFVRSLSRYVDYVRHLWTSRPPLDDTQAFESPFYDYLQIPLQPLADNLESNTYEVFEQDPVKYVAE
jgi:protein arginine N-methyltransferase 5